MLFGYAKHFYTFPINVEVKHANYYCGKALFFYIWNCVGLDVEKASTSGNDLVVVEIGW